MNVTSRGAWLVIGAAMLWGTTGTAQALGPAAATPTSVGAVRLILGGACLAGLAAKAGSLRPAIRLLSRKATWVATAGMVLYQPAFFSGVERAGVAVGTMVAIGSGPVFVGLMDSTISGNPQPRRWVLATGVTVAGVGALTLTGPTSEVDPLGVGLALVAGLAYALYTIAARRIARSTPALTNAGTVFGLAGIVSIPLAVSTDLGWLGDAAGLASAAWLGLGATALAYVLFSAGLRHTDAPTASTLALAEPATATILGITVLAERPGALTWLGVSLVAVGVTMAARGPANQAPPTEAVSS